MRILYVSPENVTGGFNLFSEGHRRLGNDCRFITFFRNRWHYPEDLCFNLRLMPDQSWLNTLRKSLRKSQGIPDQPDLEGNPPYWKPNSRLEANLYRLRDFINGPVIKRTIEKYQLNNYEIYHFEQGIDPFRDGHWVSELANKGKGIVCFYHGSDFRNRGVIETVHRCSQLNLTSEIDLLHRMKGMKYLYLPIDTEQIKPVPKDSGERIRIGHAARNRAFKGSDYIEQIVLKLSKVYPIDWIMIENLPHPQALELKATCDIVIDQITDAGGWGYGASSVESLAMGIPTMTMINPEVEAFLGDHPFVPITKENLERQLIQLLENPDLRIQLAEQGRAWVIQRHGLMNVMRTLYSYYTEAGLA